MKHIFGIKKISGFKVFLVFLILFLFFLKAFSQTETPDSLLTFSDTTKVAIDSLIFSTKEEIITKYQLDNSLLQLFSSVPYAFYENFHLYIPFDDFTLKKMNDFILYNKDFTTSIYYQMFFPIYKNSYGNGFIQKEYSEVVPLLNSYAGIGSENMNYAFLDFRKGNLWKKINLNFSYLGDDGKWNIRDNSSKNFHIHGKLNTKLGFFSYTKDILKRDLPKFYFTNISDDNKPTNISINRDELKYECKGLAIAFQRFKTTYADSIKNTQYQIYLGETINWNFIKIMPNYRLIKEDSTVNYAGSKLDIQKGKINITTDVLGRFKDARLYQNYSAQYKPTEKMNFSVTFLQDKIFYNFSKAVLSAEYRNIKVNFGKKKKQRFSTYFQELRQDSYFRFSKYGVHLQNATIHHDLMNKDFPLWVLKSNLYIERILNYNNKIFVGFEYFFMTNDNDFKYYDIFLHPYFGVAITDRFSLQVDFENLTNEYSFNMLSLSPYHVNVGFKWLFFN